MGWDAGRVCLNLVAARGERLGSGAALGEWLGGSGVVPAGTEPAADGEWLAAFLGLREVLERVVAAELAGERGAAADIAELNRLALAAPPAPCAVLGEDGTLVRALAAPPDRAGLLAAVARDAVDLLTDPLARSQLRVCEGESCELVYLDTSRGRRRRWCSSEVCGNRERVARHRRRTTMTRARG
ncbi:ABATE domain-containing protein [Streptomyces sp. NPDC051976]|uniref:CGNR zinc finger domain-containing protein n=1 Tax=Streptomyces sp. NPDC051976 TaxID=3154947 RepID=UPI00344485CF